MQTRDFNKNILETIFDMINREGKRLVLLGDFNTNLLAYKENKEVREFFDILQNNLTHYSFDKLANKNNSTVKYHHR